MSTHFREERNPHSHPLSIIVLVTTGPLDTGIQAFVDAVLQNALTYALCRVIPTHIPQHLANHKLWKYLWKFISLSWRRKREIRVNAQGNLLSRDVSVSIVMVCGESC